MIFKASFHGPVRKWQRKEEYRMRRYVIFYLISFMSLGRAESDEMPAATLKSNQTSKTMNHLHSVDKWEQPPEDKREKEMLENRYHVPDKKEEEDFNKNGP
jgi:hypothetical protein